MNREQHSDTGSTPTLHPASEITTSLDQLSLASTSGACQHCGRSFIEGDEIVAYVSKPADQRIHEVGHCVCAHNEHRQQEVFTLGVHELLVAGRIGRLGRSNTVDVADSPRTGPTGRQRTSDDDDPLAATGDTTRGAGHADGDPTAATARRSGAGDGQHPTDDGGR